MQMLIDFTSCNSQQYKSYLNYDIEIMLFNISKIGCFPVTGQQVWQATAKDAILSDKHQQIAM